MKLPEYVEECAAMVVQGETGSVLLDHQYITNNDGGIIEESKQMLDDDSGSFKESGVVNIAADLQQHDNMVKLTKLNHHHATIGEREQDTISL